MPKYDKYISSSWVEMSLCIKFHVPRLAGSDISMVGDNKTKQFLVELVASLAPARAEVGAEAKADQRRQQNKTIFGRIIGFLSPS